MKKIILNTTIIAAFAIVISSCKKEKTEAAIPDISTKVFSDFSVKVATATYKNISDKSAALNTSVNNLATTPNDANITEARNNWRALRNEWEQSESFLFGPVATEGMDPAIDTWPVNKNDLDSLLASSVVFTDSYIQNVQESLKGFHPLEYILFGANGNKLPNEITAREKEYMVALAKDLKRICTKMHTSWDAANGNFSNEFATAGTGSATYKTKKDAMLELINAMAGICDEVANGKIEEPFIAQDPSLEESPFSKNSFGDFKNNIQGVLNVYTCTYGTTGASISQWVQLYNKSLDARIKQELATAIASFTTFTKPFGQAIIDEPVQIINAQKNINILKETLEKDLVTLVQANVKN